MVVAMIICAATAVKAQNDNRKGSLDKIFEIERLINESYYDTFDRDKLVEITIHSVFGYLDPHTVYKTAKEAAEDERKYGSEKNAIGGMVALLNDTLTILSVTPRSPAYKAGLRPGMQIDSINDQPVTNRVLKPNQIAEFINLRDDTIKISLIRGKGKQRKVLLIAKDKLTDPGIDSYYAPNDSTAYIRIAKFTKYTGEEFDNILEEFGPKKLRNLILDLRDNPGGVLQACAPICNHIVPANSLLYTATDTHNGQKPEFSDKNGLLKNSRIYILINENSASASEIIASCIQDNDRGIIIGRRSFGKALTQQVTIFSDGSKALISNGKVFSPSGRCIQKDYQRGRFDKYRNELKERITRRENVLRDSINTAGKPTYKTVIKHRTVYGNMGVIPDCFVPEDYTNAIPLVETEYADSIYMLLKFFGNVFVNEHRQRLKNTYGSFKNFNKSFFVSDEMVKEFYIVRRDEKHYPAHNIIETKTPNNKDRHIKKLIKAYIAKAFFGYNEFRQLINEDDSDFQAALLLVADPQAYWNYLK